MIIASARNGRGFVSFIGAGPGDPELITLKGLRRLREADIVIHDRLVPLVLLDEARHDAEIIDVGKTPRRHCIAQGDINRLLVDRARAGHCVARVKGGDPSVFGRLPEEVRAVRQAGILLEIVPGVTAATAAAARAGIALTERGTSSMVVLATGVDHTGGLTATLDWHLLAQAEATLVFYMAVRELDSITATLVARGRDPRQPALIAERVGSEGERLIVGHLGQIADEACRSHVRSPAVLITGPTVGAAMTALDLSREPVEATERVDTRGRDASLFPGLP